MKEILYCAAVFCCVAVISCREKPASTPTFSNRQASLPTGSAVTTPAKSVLPVNNINPVATNAGKGMINPAHGQPGHRCDVAVGATIPSTIAAKPTSPVPLLSNPAAPAIVPTTVQNTAPKTATVTPPAAAGLNPAHGQPGHRCDIAVGAPLNSKPAAKPAATITPSVAKPAAVAPDTFLAKGLNPAHGQPGHRCDVGVGKPLSDAKKTESNANEVALPKPATGTNQ